MRSRRIEVHRDKIFEIYEAFRDITLEELRAELAKSGLSVAVSSLHRFFERHGKTRKKECRRLNCRGQFTKPNTCRGARPTGRSETAA